MSLASDDLTMSIDYMRQEIKDAMDSNALLSNIQGRGEGLASINRVTYLGDSVDDVFRTSPTVLDGVKSITETQVSGQGRYLTVTIMASSLCAAAVVMLLAIALLVAKRQRKEKSQDKQVIISVDDEDDYDGATITSYHDEDMMPSPPPSEDDLRAQAREAERQYAPDRKMKNRSFWHPFHRNDDSGGIVAKSRRETRFYKIVSFT